MTAIEQLEVARVWVATLSTPGVILVLGLLIRRQLTGLHADILRTVVESFGTLEQSLTTFTQKLVSMQGRMGPGA